mmetsp:Transcript_29865/g.46847  ORF Transcript_29865/g.46847 Transcript_29865/m.46847 type:complete len:81 (-) Transcript_29865:813-1055(-)
MLGAMGLRRPSAHSSGLKGWVESAVDPESYAREVVALLTNEELWSQQSAAAKAFSAAHFHHSNLQEEVGKMLQTLSQARA